jgi:hypothetical protein
VNKLHIGIIGNHESISRVVKERLEQVGFCVGGSDMHMTVEINTGEVHEVRCNTDIELAELMRERLNDFGDYCVTRTSKIHNVPYLELSVPEKLTPIDVTAIGRTIAHVILKFYE